MAMNYLKKVIWPAVYITLFFSAIWALLISGLNIALISMRDESAISFLSVASLPFIVGIGILFLSCLLGGHWIYQHSNGAHYLRLINFLPKYSAISFLILILFLSCGVQQGAAAATPFTEDATQKAEAVITSLYGASPAGPWIAMEDGVQRSYLCKETTPCHNKNRREIIVVLTWDGDILADGKTVGRWDIP